MAQLSVAAAAKLVAKDRKTLYRMLKEGRLSATQNIDGQRQIETSELVRVFGTLKHPDDRRDRRDSRETDAVPQRETRTETDRIALLEAELRHARELLEVKDGQIQDLRQSIRLLDATRQPVTVQKKIFWPWSKSK